VLLVHVEANPTPSMLGRALVAIRGGHRAGPEGNARLVDQIIVLSVPQRRQSARPAGARRGEASSDSSLPEKNCPLRLSERTVEGNRTET
jgi:hypothetical protein